MGKRRAFVLDDLYGVREASDPRLSPDGERVAFVVTWPDRSDDANRSAIWAVPCAGGEPAELTRGPHDASPRWSPDGADLAFLRREDGLAQIWLLPAGGGEARKLTDFALGASGFVWSPDGSTLAVLAPVDIDGEPVDERERTRRAHAPVVVRTVGFKADGVGLIGTKRVHLHVVDVQTASAEPLTKGDFNAATPAWSPDGKRIAFAGRTPADTESGRSRLYTVSPQGGAPDEVARWDGTAVAPVFRADGRSIVFCGQARVAPGHTRLFEVRSTGGRPKPLLGSFDRNVMIGGPAYPGALPAFTDDGRLVFCARDRGCTHIYALEGDDAVKLIGGHDRVASSVSVSGDRLAFVVSAPDIPSDVFVARTDGSRKRRLTNLSSELLAEVTPRAARSRTFTAPDGRKIHGWLVEGKGKGPRPLLLDVHGGPHNAWNPAFLPGAHLYQELLADQGWSTLLLNPRGSDGYGEDFMNAVTGGWGLADEHDFLSAIDALVDEGAADPKRLAVCGYSYGGYMANWLTARTGPSQTESLRSIQFSVAVAGGCVSNEVSMYGSSDLGYWIGAHEMGAELHEARERYALLSPLSYVENVQTPTLLLHGENDDRCPVGQAEEWFVALRRRGIDVELVRYPGASHLFILNGRPSHRIDYSRRIVEWLTSHV